LQSHQSFYIEEVNKKNQNTIELFWPRRRHAVSKVMVAGRDGFGLRLRVQDFAVFALLLTGLFSAFVADASPQDGALTDEFVVEVPRGEGVARRLAARHGLIFEGRVSEALGEFFSLRHAASKRRAKRSVETHLANLENEDEVTWVERQVLLTRNKRGFGDERREDALEEAGLRWSRFETKLNY
jgi:hypothetical protein